MFPVQAIDHEDTRYFPVGKNLLQGDASRTHFCIPFGVTTTAGT